MTAPIFTAAAGREPRDDWDDWDDLDDKTLVPTGKTARELDKPAPDQFAKTDARSELSLGSGRSTVENRNQVAMFKCNACRGSGRFVRGYINPVDYGPCNKCKGTGKLKTDPETRAKQKKAREDKKKAAVGAYITAHIAEYTWAVSNLKFDFARSMADAIRQHGSWTDGQLAALRRCMARDEERKKEREMQAQKAPQLTGEGFQRMLDAFARARSAGLKWPKLRVEPYVFSLPGAQSKYAGHAVFVKHNNDGYLGRIDIVTGRWFPTDAGRGHDEQVKQICRDPLAAAVMHGKQTGHCSCCGLELTNEESVRLGIGPICREKWGL